MATMDTLEALREALADIAGVASCAIGIEANIGPSDYPMIRLVPSRLTPGKPYAGRTVETLIYFGAQTANSEGLETVYDDLFSLEGEILESLKDLGHRYIETITDEDRLDAYKLMTIRCELVDPVATPVDCLIACSASTETLSGTAAVVAPFDSTIRAGDAADWTINLTNGTISRLLNGATSTITRITINGSVAGAAASTVTLGIYKGGVLASNLLTITTAGATIPVQFSLSCLASATGSATFDVRATGTAGDYVFAMTMRGESASSRAVV